MVLYFIALVVFGIVMGIATGIVADNVKICGDETRKLAEKHKAGCEVRIWLYIFGLVIYLSLALLVFRICFGLENEIKELESKIEVLEQQVPQVDTTAVNIENL
jgi:hypothetical protein